MQKVRVPISSFQFGEVSDSLSSRIDTPILNSSAERVENFVVMPEGSLKKRHGLKHIYDYNLTYDASNPIKSQLTSFVFDDNEQYIISIEHEKLRAFRLLTDGSVSLVATVTSDVNSNDLPFDQDYLNQYSYAQYGDVLFVCHPLFAPRVITRTSLTAFEVSTFSFDVRSDNKIIYQPYYDFQSQGIALDPAATTGTGVNVRAYAIVEADDDAVATEQSVSLTLSLDGALGSGGTATLNTLQNITFTSAAGSDNSGTTISINGTNKNGTTVGDFIAAGPGPGETITTTTEWLSINYIDANSGCTNMRVGVGNKDYDISYFTSDHVGVTLKYHDSEMTVTNYFSPTNVNVDIVDTLKIRLTVLNPLRTNDGSSAVEITQLAHGFAGGESITVEDASAVGGINASDLNGVRTVGAIIDENTYTFTAGSSANKSEDGGGFVKLVTHSPTLDWSEQAFSAVRGYPAAVAFHENRLVFAGTLAQPDTIWMSKIGQFFNFDFGDAEDTDAIDLTAATGQVNEIRYMISNRDLQVFGASGELYVPTYLNQAITPTNAQIRKQTPYGTEYIQPASIDGATVFVQHDGYTVREYLYTDGEDAYTASAVSTLSSHLIQQPKSMTVVHSGFNLPDSYAMFVLENGEAALFSSNRAEKRASWSRLTCRGNFDSAVAVHNRLFVNAYDEDDKLQLCEFVGDVGLDFYLYEAISANAVDVSALYNDEDVVDVILTDGSKQSYVGTLTVNSSEEIDLTAYSGVGFTHAYVGKKFNAKIVTNAVDAVVGNGPMTGEVRGIGTVVLDLKDSRSIKVNNRSFVQDSSFTGKKEIRILGHSRDPKVTIEQNDPLSLQVNGLIAELII